jgi:lipid-A-disaccharide synthase
MVPTADHSAGPVARGDKRPSPAAIDSGEPIQVAVVAGEASGDAQAAALLDAARRGGASIEAWGIGGAALRAGGVELLYDSSAWGAIGVIESLRLVAPLLLALRRLRHELARRRPDVVLLVDFGYFNVRVARAAKRLGLPVFYYFPPGSWNRRRSAGDLPQLTDRIVTPFPWSAETLRAASADAYWVGHPLVEQLRPSGTTAALRREFGLAHRAPTVALMPGSRTAELRYHLPLVAGVARLLTERRTDVQFLVAAAPTVDPGALDRAFGRNVRRRVVAGRTADLLGASDLVLTKTGTSTLEAAILGLPMVTFYTGSWLMGVEYRLRGGKKRFPRIAMPNLLADDDLVTELRAEEATPERLAAEAESLLSAPERRQTLSRRLRELTAPLAAPAGSAVSAAAELLLEFVTTRRGARA